MMPAFPSIRLFSPIKYCTYLLSVPRAPCLDPRFAHSVFLAHARGLGRGVIIWLE
jgi:hypothetical protein